jgi:hypothetical protein
MDPNQIFLLGAILDEEEQIEEEQQEGYSQGSHQPSGQSQGMRTALLMLLIFSPFFCFIFSLLLFLPFDPPVVGVHTSWAWMPALLLAAGYSAVLMVLARRKKGK